MRTLTHPGGAVHFDLEADAAVVGWPVQPLAELAMALGHRDASAPIPDEQDAEIERLRSTNASLLAMLERMETLHVTWHGPDGEEYHPDWCRECRVDKALASRPAIPADAEELRKQLLDWADVLVRGGGMVVPADIAWKLRQLAAPVPGSDTTAEAGRG